jgi:cation:H+ antiporter
LPAVLAVVVGLGLLMLASDRLVVAAVRVTQALGVSAILIGALVVGLGTSVPELLVSALAAVDDRLDVAMANVVGSNVANVTLVLGTAAVVAPVAAKTLTVRREGVLMLGSLLALASVLAGGRVDAWEGGLLVLGLGMALYLLIRWSMLDAAAEAAVAAEVEEILEGTDRSLAAELGIGVLALVTTIVSANLLLQGALSIGEDIGLSDAFLGIMLGVGTSLPELATALAATRRREPDLVVGNVLGSNIFNSLAVAGTAGLVGPAALVDLSAPAVWAMLGSAFVAGFFSRTGQLVRIEGVILVVGFLGFVYLSY